MGSSTHIYNHFEWWSADDCSCLYCRWYLGKKGNCALEVCCCETERREAARREQARQAARTEAARCQA
jgi:hypothetical protein